MSSFSLHFPSLSRPKILSLCLLLLVAVSKPLSQNLPPVVNAQFGGNGKNLASLPDHHKIYIDSTPAKNRPEGTRLLQNFGVHADVKAEETDETDSAVGIVQQFVPVVRSGRKLGRRKLLNLPANNPTYSTSDVRCDTWKFIRFAASADVVNAALNVYQVALPLFLLPNKKYEVICIVRTTLKNLLNLKGSFIINPGIVLLANYTLLVDDKLSTPTANQAPGSPAATASSATAAPATVSAIIPSNKLSTSGSHGSTSSSGAVRTTADVASADVADDDVANSDRASFGALDDPLTEGSVEDERSAYVASKFGLNSAAANVTLSGAAELSDKIDKSRLFVYTTALKTIALMNGQNITNCAIFISSDQSIHQILSFSQDLAPSSSSTMDSYSLNACFLFGCVAQMISVMLFSNLSGRSGLAGANLLALTLNSLPPTGDPSLLSQLLTNSLSSLLSSSFNGSVGNPYSTNFKSNSSSPSSTDDSSLCFLSPSGDNSGTNSNGSALFSVNCAQRPRNAHLLLQFAWAVGGGTIVIACFSAFLFLLFWYQNRSIRRRRRETEEGRAQMRRDAHQRELEEWMTRNYAADLSLTPEQQKLSRLYNHPKTVYVHLVMPDGASSLGISFPSPSSLSPPSSSSSSAPPSPTSWVHIVLPPSRNPSAPADRQQRAPSGRRTASGGPTPGLVDSGARAAGSTTDRQQRAHSSTSRGREGHTTTRVLVESGPLQEPSSGSETRGMHTPVVSVDLTSVGTSNGRPTTGNNEQPVGQERSHIMNSSPDMSVGTLSSGSPS